MDDEKRPALMDELLQKINFSSSSVHVTLGGKKDVVHIQCVIIDRRLAVRKALALMILFDPSLHRRLCTAGGITGGRNKKMMTEGATEGQYCTPLPPHAWMATIHMRIETQIQQKIVKK